MTKQRILYVVSRWGEPTQTFVRREADAVQDTGRPVGALSIKSPGQTSSGIECWHLGSARVVIALLRAICRHPVRVLRTLGCAAFLSAPRNAPRQVVAAAHGLAWAADGLVTGDEVLHAHFGWVAATAAWAAGELTGSPISVVLHAFELHKPALIDRFTPVPLRRAAAVFTISDADRRLVRDRWAIEAETLRMGVPEDWLLPGTEVRDPWLIVSIGSLVPKKGHDILLRAVSRIDCRWRLVIAGEGPERQRLQDLREALGLADRVTLAGWCDEGRIRWLLDRAAVACLACVQAPDGDRDGIPVALIEAMARGVAVVTTRLGAVPELVDGAGLLVAPGSVEELADSIESLTDSASRMDLAEKGRERVQEEFVVSRTAHRLAQL